MRRQPSDADRRAALAVAQTLYLICDWIPEAKQREALLRLSKRTGKPIDTRMREAITEVLAKYQTAV